jgi:hypothetical protein
MFGIKPVLLCALALLALGAVAAASASAADRYVICVKEKGGHYANKECSEESGSGEWEKLVLEVGTNIDLGAEGGPSTLATGKFTIECPADKTKAGNLHGAGTSNYYIEFDAGKCKVYNKANQETKCTVSDYYLNLEGVLGATVIEDPYGPVTFNELSLLSGSEVTLNGCSKEGTYKFEGNQTCKMPKLEELTPKHEMICEPSGSDIEIEGGEKGVTFTDTEHVHVFGDYWGAEV